MKVLTCLALLLTAALLAPPSPAWAQLLQGTIDGNVTDSTQAAVAGAEVTAINQQTNFTRETKTNSVGGYSLPTLPPGTYTVKVTAQGFQTYSRTGIAVTSETITRVDIGLSVGQVNEVVTVSASTVNLQTDRADVRSEMNAQTLANVPVPIGRNYQMLFVTLPGVSPPTNSNSFGANPNRGLSFSVNGGNTATNSTRVDGTGTFNFTANSTAQYVPALEAIEQVSMATNSFDAEQTSGGGAVNLTVKSGTNNLHGTLYEDHANQHFKAYAWDADRTQPKPKYINNQFGGAIGGPIRKDKLFYFVSFEGTRYSESTAIVGQVPNAAMKTGDLSRSPNPIYDPLTGSADGSGRTAFLNNIIPKGRIDPGSQNLINTGEWGDPNQPGTGTFGLGRNFLRSGSGYLRRDQFDNKLNWTASPKFSMFVRFGFSDSNWVNQQLFGLLGGPILQRSNTAFGLGFTHVFSGTVSGTYVVNSNLIIDGYFGYSRNDNSSRQSNSDQNLGWTLLQIPGLNTSALPKYRQIREGGMPRIAIDGFALLGPANQFQPQDFRDPERNYAANINWIKGTHNIRAGFDSDLLDSNEMQYEAPGSGTGTSAGGFHFTQGTTQLRGGAGGNDFNAFASFLLGFVQDGGKIYHFPDEFYTRSKYFAGYVRDRWQATPKLTVSYGVRFDYYPFPRRLGRGLEQYDADRDKVLICGLGPNPADCGISKDRQRFVPRLGVAYRLTDSTVVRAGYGIATDPILTVRRENYPDLMAQVIQAPNTFSYAITLRQGLPPVPPPDLSTGIVSIPSNVAVTSYDNNNYVRGYIQTWNLTVEQRVKNWLASAGYVATRAVDPQLTLQQNWSPIGTGTAGQLLNPRWGRTALTNLVGTSGTTKYDSLQTRLQGRFAGYQLVLGYTFGKSLGYGTTVAIPAYYRSKNYGPLGNDIAHNLEMTGIAELPFGKGKRWAQGRAASTLLGGWQLSGVFSAYTGRPFTVTASNTTLNAQFSTQFADCVSTPVQTGNIFQWYDKSSFAAPSAGRFGTCGQNRFRGPGLINSDLGIDRKFPIREKFQLNFRAEVFNIGNTPHHAIPNSTTANVSNGTFMQATDISNTGREGIDERAVRFSLKVTW